MRTLSTLLLSSVLLVALVGCGGSGGSSFSAAKTGSGTGGGPATQYSSPVTLTANVSVINVSPNGHMVGADGAGVALYWATPTSAPVTINPGPYSGFFVSGINNAGQMVGFVPISGVFSGVYWSSPSATPVLLPAPVGSGGYGGATINVHGEIVGRVGVNASSKGVYWASPTSTPTLLAGVGGGSNSGEEAVRISDGGEIIGAGVSGTTLVWTSPTANAQVITLAGGDTVTGSINPLGLAFNQETGEVGGTATVVTMDLAFQWTLPNFTFQLLHVPSGFQGETVLCNIGPNHLGVGQASAGANIFAAIWPTLTGNYVDLNTLIPSGSGLTLGSALFVTDSGDIIGTALNSGNQQVYYTVHRLQ